MEAGVIKADALGPPRCNAFLTIIGKLWLRIWGWEIEGSLPSKPKFVIILAPHTSNWDGLLILPAAMALGLKFNFLGKKELFAWPIGGLVRWLGGIPVDRHASIDLVGQIVDEVAKRDQVIIGIAPEGTRSLTKYWKSGFYHIAKQANLPLSFAYLDYDRKRAGFNEGITISGDVEADLALIRRFFSKVKPKHPEKAGKVAFKPHGEHK